MSFSDFNHILALQNLISESGDCKRDFASNLQPNIPGSKIVVKTAANAPHTRSKNANPDDIWTEAEIPTEEALLCTSFDNRLTPQYEFLFKSAVGTTDMFLGICNSSPLTSDSTYLVVKIHFPGATMKEIDLDVKTSFLRASSPSHRLITSLPCKVETDKGDAKFDKETEILSVVLTIIPAYNYFNRGVTLHAVLSRLLDYSHVTSFDASSKNRCTDPNPETIPN